MQILFKDSAERLDYLINECLKDLDLYGMYHSVALIFKDGFVLEDYEHQEDLKLYADEKAYKVKLIELLIMLYSFKTNTKIGSVLRAFRMANDLSIDALTKELGIPYRTYQDWELGNRMPNAKDLFIIIRRLEIDMEYIEKAFEIKKIGDKKMLFKSFNELAVDGARGGFQVFKTAKGIMVEEFSLYNDTDLRKTYYSDYPKLPKDWKEVINELGTEAWQAWYENLKHHTPYRSVKK